MRILGIDPGFERLGIAVLDGEKVIFSDCFKTKASLPFAERLLLIGEKVRGIISEYRPEALAIETLYLSNNQRTAMRVAEARGVILYECSRSGLRIYESSPPEIKLAVAGDGRADKKQMMKMVKMLTKIDKNKDSDDELDAIAIALCAGAKMRG